MDERDIFLQALEAALREAGAGELRSLERRGEALALADGKLRLEVEILRGAEDHPATAHCHVLTRTLKPEVPPLEACVVGIHRERAESLAQAARNWVALAAGPVYSLFLARPVLGAVHFGPASPEGVAGAHGFSGPVGARLFGADFDPAQLLEARPFAWAAALAPPTHLHLVKVTISCRDGVWTRSVEVNGHAASAVDHRWGQGLPALERGIFTLYATFHSGGDQAAVDARRQVDEAIEACVAALGAGEDARQALAGFPTALAETVDAFVPLAFGRVFLRKLGPAAFPACYTALAADGSATFGLPLMAEPAFARALVRAERCRSAEPALFERIARCSPEISALNDGARAGEELAGARLAPPVVAAAGASEADVRRALTEGARRRGS